MWRMKKWIEVSTEIRKDKRVLLKRPQRELVEDREIEDIEFIRMLVMWINIGKVEVSPMYAEDDEFKEELRQEGINAGDSAFGYIVRWISNTGQLYEYKFEDIGPDKEEDDESETDSCDADKQLGWFGSLRRYIQGR